jgi:hypothetical protein
MSKSAFASCGASRSNGPERDGIGTLIEDPNALRVVGS